MSSWSETTLNRAAWPPKRTFSTSSNHLPLITTVVPPAVGPVAGDKPVTVATRAALVPGTGGDDVVPVVDAVLVVVG